MTDSSDLRLDPALGTRLALDPYRADFAEIDNAVRDRSSWKFERLQHFEEQDDPSRDALTEGRWEDALRLLEAEHDDWLAAARREEERRAPFHRVRVVEEPLTPYMQWESHALRVQAKAGKGIRVIGADRVREWEPAGPLPEVVVLGDLVLYEVLYTDAGVLDGCRRYTDPELIGRWTAFIQGLYEEGEDVVSYVDRYVAHLPSPFPEQGQG
ncbi:hypothetical protein SAMN06297387_102201 [Streptomyces zhaozhouensis]|uniref:DUF6879 domain-containing protein n=1 Tax=Streptomyces zhaozhouensis TaxID=1300267 RepID=A0A286DPT2_9ACTN|nr:DUF6879 family protein [Streptomyces zhaozhouensis]SOD60650.1 hypothetical protein SAMN06297387_102201 [Streptomyces zhaozhouensis]